MDFGLKATKSHNRNWVAEALFAIGGFLGPCIASEIWGIPWIVSFVLYVIGILSVFLATANIRKFISKRSSIDRAIQAKQALYRAAIDAHQSRTRAALEQQQKLAMESLAAKRRELKWWRSLPGYGFERELQTLLRAAGYAVRRTGRSGDGGVDLMLQRDGRRVIVQCKAHRARVGPGAVRDLYGTFLHESGTDEAWLVATHGFSKAAREFAAGKSIRLLTVEQLLKEFGPEAC